MLRKGSLLLLLLLFGLFIAAAALLAYLLRPPLLIRGLDLPDGSDVVSQDWHVTEGELVFPIPLAIFRERRRSLSVTFDNQGNWEQVQRHFRDTLLEMGYQDVSTPMSISTTNPKGTQVQLFNDVWFRNERYSVMLRDLGEHAAATAQEVGASTGVGQYSVAVYELEEKRE